MKTGKVRSQASFIYCSGYRIKLPDKDFYAVHIPLYGRNDQNQYDWTPPQHSEIQEEKYSYVIKTDEAESERVHCISLRADIHLWT